MMRCGFWPYLWCVCPRLARMKKEHLTGTWFLSFPNMKDCVVFYPKLAFNHKNFNTFKYSGKILKK